MYRHIALFFILILFSLNLTAQTTNFEDGFEDGDFTNNPTWSGDTGQYAVINGNPNFQLQLQGDATNGGVSYLSTPSTNVVGSWQFYVNLDFSPSGGNRTDVFLMSDIADLESTLNGYALRGGEGGSSDVFRIVRYDGGSEAATVLSGTTDISNGGEFRVRVTRQSGGNWTLEVAQGYGGILAQEGGSATDNTYTSSNFFGVRSTYTSSRADLFFYDFKIDLPPFDLAQATLNTDQVDVSFNRPYDQTTVQAADFSVDNGIGTPSSVSFPNATTVRLNYTGSSFPSNRYTVTVNDVDDQNGNTIAANSTTGFVVFGTFAQGDIIINEFMKDPPTGQSEYVELRNTSAKILNLQNWALGDDGGADVITTNNLVIEPNGFLVISDDTTSLFNVYGTRAYFEVGSLDAFNNDSDVVQVNDDTGSQVDSLMYTPEWGGVDVALERRSATASSTFLENFGDSPNSLGGTPGLTNEVGDDTTPPDLTGLGIPDGQTLELAFTERLQTSAAQNTTNYTLDNGITINSAQQIAADSVRLNLASALQNGTSYQLNIANQQDIFGNTTATIDTSFTFFEISRADSGKVFINEFTYDPPSGSTEYIELHNPTSQSFDLNGWTLNDSNENREIITNSRTVLPPDSFIVLAPDQTLLNNFPDINLVTMGSNFPSLNNGGDNIVIRRADGTLLDSLTYNSSYGGNNVATERRTTDVSGNFAANFGDAPNGFGTPGSANEIAPDQTAPTFDRVTATNSTSFTLIFSENLDSDSATNTANYTITPNRNITLIVANRDTVTLLVDPPLQSGTTYDVTVNNIQDVFGNTLNNASRQVEFLEFSAAQPGDLRINEILYSRESGGGPEFVELFNTSDRNIDLSGWVIGDASGTTTLGIGTQVQAGAYLVLTDNFNFAGSLDNGEFVSNFPSLNDSGDAVYIRTDQDITIDSLFYSETWGGGNPGESLERIDPLGASNDANNFGTSTAPSGNTAGEQNSLFAIDQESPGITFAKFLGNGNIEVQFNEFIQLNQDLTFSSGGATLNIINFDPSAGNIIELSAPPAKRKATEVNVTAQNLTDVRGNTTASDEIPIAQKLNPAEVVINEILFNPLNESDDNLPDQNEYIELRNTADFAVSMEGVFIHDEPDENGDVRAIIPVSTQAKWVPAQGLVLIYADAAPLFQDSQIAEFFDLNPPSLISIIRADRGSLSLASSGDAVFLADSTGATIDSVFYDESWHNPNLIDTRGIALERIDPNGPSNVRSNWSSSTNPSGGSPTQENTIFQTPENLPQQTGITFDPNPFSPDDDGNQDNLFINYQLDQPDYLIKVRIYDRYGRLVRELADGAQAGFQGSLTWDGRKDDGTRNRIGIYIVVFEAFNSSTGQDLAFKETVVLARRLK